MDITPNDISAKFRQQLHAAVCRWKKENMGGLPRQVTIAVNQQYGLISNIAVEVGLISGLECCIKYIKPQVNN